VSRLALILMLVACGGSKPPPPVPAPLAQRPITMRHALPVAIQPLLPVHGIYVAGGGHVSAAWRVVIDTDKNSIYAGTSTQRDAPSFGPMQKESTKDLSQRNKELLTQLAEDAWREPPAKQPEPSVDYGEIFVVLDGDDTFLLQGHPIRQPLAVKAITELRAAAGL